MIFAFACGQQNNSTQPADVEKKEEYKNSTQTMENKTEPTNKDTSENRSVVVDSLSKEAGERKQNMNLNPYFSAYEEIHTALASGNLQAADKFTDKNLGLYIIYSNGAMPKVAHVYSFSQFKTDLNQEIKDFKFIQEKKAAVEEELPKVVCDEHPYDKQGVFGQQVNIYTQNPIWEYTDMNEKEKQAAQFTAEKITYTIINTADYVYCFGEIDGQIKLLFLDLRTPCTA